jgi:hypothetical protein
MTSNAIDATVTDEAVRALDEHGRRIAEAAGRKGASGPNMASLTDM